MVGVAWELAAGQSEAGSVARGLSIRKSWAPIGPCGEAGLLVLLLADVFENFRDMALREYKLDPAHSWTVPGFAWNCALKISKAELELITDPETFFFRKFNSRRYFDHQSPVCQSK